MNLPIRPPYPPMEAKIAREIPVGQEWQYEPKWDGFRCLAFRDHDTLELQSKAGQPLTRYFPEIVEALKNLSAQKFVLDGEIIVTVDGRLSFDDLLQRIHPAASRVNKLAKETPARLIVFDVLVDAQGTALAAKPLEERRKALEKFAAKFLKGNRRIELSPSTRDVKVAQHWLKTMRGQLDGIIAKPLLEPYQSGQRAMQKIKTIRTVDCVVGGFRYASSGKVVGSLLLGLYDDEGLLNHVGFTSSFKSDSRKEITQRVEALKGPPGFTGRAPGGPSRWSTDRSGEWEPLKTKLVVEVQYDHFSGGRFRHGAKFLRWRPDKPPEQCLMEQVER